MYSYDTNTWVQTNKLRTQYRFLLQKTLFKSRSQKAHNNQIICVLPSENNLHQAPTNQRQEGSISINYFYTQLMHKHTIQGLRDIQI